MVVTEEHFQQLLDENPADSTVRMIFADWLDEQGDLRAGGYRELGRLGKYPNLAPGNGFHHNLGRTPVWEWWHYSEAHFSLCERWFDSVECIFLYCPSRGTSILSSKDFLTRREADNAAAIAYHHYRAGVAASTGSEPR